MEGILVIDKPVGMSSFDVVENIRMTTNTKKVGHGGTLDPKASGVLVILLGKTTKLFQKVVALEKEYIGTVYLGVETETLDGEGKIVKSTQISEIKQKQINEIIPRFIGYIEQIPPQFSALKIKGKRLYSLAREKKFVSLPPRVVFIKNIKIEEYSPPFLTLRVICGRGTYIRSLARDLGKELGCGAYLYSLKRLRVGPFHLKEALSLENIQTEVKIGHIKNRLLSPSVIYNKKCNGDIS